jgi:hypothetical protein
MIMYLVSHKCFLLGEILTMLFAHLVMKLFNSRLNIALPKHFSFLSSYLRAEVYNVCAYKVAQ